MLPFGKAKPIIDQDSETWLNEMFDWCFTYLDADLFKQKTQLILPNDQFFPGRIDSADKFAETIFHHVSRYSFMQHWGIKPHVNPSMNNQILLPSELGVRTSSDAPAVNQVFIPYNPRQIKYPEAMIATTAQQFSQLLLGYVQQPVPGNQATLPWAVEVIGVFLGFGIMFANTAYEFRGGCGCSYDPSKNRPAQLAQPETVHALAMFCYFKGIKANAVTPHLKPHLRPMLKQSLKYLQQSKAK